MKFDFATSLLWGAAILLVVSCNESTSTPTVILAPGNADVYREEFAKSLVLATNRLDREGWDPTRFYFPSTLALKSPDGVYRITETAIRDYHHVIKISKNGSRNPQTVLVLQEPSPQSGRAHSFQWSKDSKAVFIYGGGKPVGHPRTWELMLVYLVDDKTLHSVDLKPLLVQRWQDARQGSH